MVRHLLLCLFISFFLHLTIVQAFFCNDKSCGRCMNSRLIKCRWCKRDNRCHNPGAVLTNPCSRAENIVSKSHCDDELPRYDPKLAYKMLLLSAAAYDSVDPQECLNNSLPSGKFQLQAVVTKNCDVFNNSCSGYVAVSHALKVIVVAYRGSLGSDQSAAIAEETLLKPMTTFLRGKVQSYWKRGFELLWQASMKAEVEALLSKNPKYKIWVAGYSLGGAMASLTSTWISSFKLAPRENIILYTFGMPRVGNYDYALQHDQLVNNSWRVVNENDLIPHFPIVVGVPNIFTGPYHHGVEVFYSDGAASVYSKHRECHGKPYNEDATCSFAEKHLSIKRHLTYFSIPVGGFWKTRCLHPWSKSERHRKTPRTEFFDERVTRMHWTFLVKRKTGKMS